MTSVIRRNLRLLITCAFILPLSNLYAQSYAHVRGFEPGWVWLDPQPNCESHSAFAKTAKGFVLYDNSPTKNGIVTSDNGASWSPFEILDSAGHPLMLVANSIQFVSDSLGIAYSDTLGKYGLTPGFACQSTDGGLRWIRIGAFPNVFDHCRSFKMIDANLGWTELEGYQSGPSQPYVHELFMTRDGCKSWHAIRTDTIDQYGEEDVSFADSLHGWLLQVRGNLNPGFQLSRTTNGGTTWNIVVHDTVTTFLPPIHFIDSLRGTGVYGMTESFTTDAGRTWRPIWNHMYTTSDSMLSISGIDVRGNFAVASYPAAPNSVNFSFIVFESTPDFGDTWHRDTMHMNSYIPFPTNGIVINDSTAAFIGEGGLLKFTCDHGRTWAGNRNDTAGVIGDLNDVFFLDHHTGFATTYESSGPGTLCRTQDGGRHWTKRSDIPIARQRVHAQYRDTYVWFADVNNVLFYSSNGGETFAASDVPIAGNSDDVGFISYPDSVSGWIGTRNGYVFHTTNNGLTWGRNYLENNLGSLVGLSSMEAWAFTGSIQHTTDGGVTWDSISLAGYPPVMWYSRLMFLSPQHGVLVNWKDTTMFGLETTDGGTHWHRLNHFMPWASQFFNTLHGVAFNRRTSDGGVTWSTIVDSKLYSDPEYPGGFFWIDSTEGWETGVATGARGLIHYGAFHDDTTQTVVDERIVQPGSPTMTNFPNPFTDKTIIDMSQFPGRVFSITICDALGTVVADLTEQFQKNRRVVFDGALFPSGLYFCRSVVGNQTLVRTLAVTH